MTWWRRLLRRNEYERELDAELRDHLARQAADHVQAGLPDDQARRQALHRFGSVDATKEACRDTWRTRWLERAAQDVRYAIRQWRRAPRVPLLAITSMALAIGANTAVFSLVNALLLRPLPVRAPDELVHVVVDGHPATSHPVWRAVHDHQDVLNGTFAWAARPFHIEIGAERQFIRGAWAGGAMFETLSVPAWRGRLLTDADDQRSGGPDGPVAVISHSFWQRQFNAADDAVGRRIVVAGTPVTVVGVMPPRFVGIEIGHPVDVILPFSVEPLVNPESYLDEEYSEWLRVFGRLPSDMSIEQATAGLRARRAVLHDALVSGGFTRGKFAPENARPIALTSAATGVSYVRTMYGPALMLVMGLVTVLLVVGSLNVANLLLARAQARQHEFAVRGAIGASAGRLFRQVLTEGLLLAAAGTMAGLFVAHVAGRALVAHLSTMRVRIDLDTGLDWRVLLFTIGVTVVVGVLVGLMPAVRASRQRPAEALAGATRGVVRGTGAARTASLLVAAQLALSLALLSSAALLVRSFHALTSVGTGFDATGTTLVTLDLAATGITPDNRGDLYDRLLREVAYLPEVAAAASAVNVPVNGWSWESDVRAEGKSVHAYFNQVSPGFFDIFGTSILAGRDIAPTDDAGAPRVAVVNESFARQAFGEAGAVGRTFAMPHDGVDLVEIVGVVEDAIYRTRREAPPVTVYLSMAQTTRWRPTFAIVVRPASTATDVGGAVQDTVRRVDPAVTVRVEPLDRQVQDDLVRERVLAGLSVAFGALAVLMAGVGLYGVLSYAVTSRRPEIALRMALGAEPRGIVRLVLRDVTWVAALGCFAGLGLTVLAGRAIGALLFDVQPHDPLSIAVATLALLAIAAAAAWFPASSAARTAPALALSGDDSTGR